MDVAGGHGQWLAARHVQQRSELPVAEQTPHPGAALYRARRHQRGVEVVASIEVTWAPVRMAIERPRVGWRCERGPEVRVAYAVRVRVIGQKREPVAETVLYR